MSTDQAARRRAHPDAPHEPCFTLASANQALVLVRRVVTDIVRDYNEMLVLRRRREELAESSSAGQDFSDFDRRIAERFERLNALQRELGAIGCLLKDWASGLVDFPARLDGRPVYLCWCLGEDAITHWHEVNAGFAGRRPVVGIDI